jgi:hypothetical protein
MLIALAGPKGLHKRIVVSHSFGKLTKLVIATLDAGSLLA